MAKGYKVCKVCGETYEYCHTHAPSNGFRWQDVACCPEHAEIYFREVLLARGESISDNDEIDEQDDLEIEIDFEDEDDEDLEEDDEDFEE